MALNRKIAYIDLTSGTIETKPIPLPMRRKYLGGRGLDAYLLYNHTEAGVDPLGPGNVLLISAGILGGTLASATARTHICAKSPLTGFFGSTNMGGFFAPELRWAGFDHLVIKGKAEKPVYLWIHDAEIEIRDAADVWGLNVHEAQRAIRNELGDEDVKCAVIGPAGENLVRYANVMTGLKNAGGRTGMGAVFGSKNLKGVAARGTLDIRIAHPTDALEYNQKFIAQITSAKANQTQGKLGTPFIWGATNSWGGLRVRNFQTNQLLYADDVEPERIDEICTETMGPHHMVGCFGCQVHCRAQYKVPSGPYAGEYDEGPEYTSQGAFAAEPECRSANTVLTCNHMVNMWGIDNLETGSLISWAMELFEEGILTTKETDGLDLKFGNDEALMEMIRRIVFRDGWLGDTLAEGGLRAAEKIGNNSLKYLIHVKGMSNLLSDERATPALALGIATASRGSDHLRSRPACVSFCDVKALDYVDARQVSISKKRDAADLRRQEDRRDAGGVNWSPHLLPLYPAFLAVGRNKVAEIRPGTAQLGRRSAVREEREAEKTHRGLPQPPKHVSARAGHAGEGRRRDPRRRHARRRLTPIPLN